jgi:hypothetical protein
MSQLKNISQKLFLSWIVIIFCFPTLISNISAYPLGNPVITESCTIFTISHGEKVFFGNNEDWGLNNAYLWYIPSQNISNPYVNDLQIYGAVFMGFDNNLFDENVDGWEQGGMNEYGLCFDVNGLPSTNLNLSSDNYYPFTEHILAQVLWECKTVDEVISWFSIHRLESLGGQIHYSDCNGDAVVVSASSDGKYAFTRKNTSFIVSTNFNLANKENGNYPCERFSITTNKLIEITDESKLDVAKCAEILYAVHQEDFSGTKYSNIFDPVNLKIYFNQGKSFSEQKEIDLTSKLTTPTETFEGFFGVDSLDIYIEKIETQFKSFLSPGWWVFFGLIGTVVIGVGLIKIYKKKRK